MREILLAILFSIAIRAYGQTNCSGGCGASGTIAGTSLSITGTNPQLGGVTDRRIADFTVTTDSTTSTPAFSDENAVRIQETISNGQLVNGGGTNAKKTFIPL